MIRRLTVNLGLLCTVAAVGALSSCSTFDNDPVAARVEGAELTFDVLDDLAEGSTDAGVIRAALTNWVNVVAASKGTAVITSPADIDTQRRAVVEGLLEEHGDDGQKSYELGLNGAAFLCLAAIPLADETDPDDVIQEIEDGLSIADAAEQYSTVASLATAGGVVSDDQGNECFDPDTFGQYFADIVPVLVEAEAEVGTPFSVDDGGGHQILLVLRPFDDLRADDQLLIQQAALSPVLQELIAGADVWINSRFGTWDAETAEVLPPDQG